MEMFSRRSWPMAYGDTSEQIIVNSFPRLNRNVEYILLIIRYENTETLWNDTIKFPYFIVINAMLDWATLIASDFNSVSSSTASRTLSATQRVRSSFSSNIEIVGYLNNLCTFGVYHLFRFWKHQGINPQEGRPIVFVALHSPFLILLSFCPNSILNSILLFTLLNFPMTHLCWVQLF